MQLPSTFSFNQILLPSHGCIWRLAQDISKLMYTAYLSMKEDHLLEVGLLTAALFILPLVDHQQGDRVRLHGNQGSVLTTASGNCLGAWERTAQVSIHVCVCMYARVCVCVHLSNIMYTYKWVIVCILHVYVSDCICLRVLMHNAYE